MRLTAFVFMSVLLMTGIAFPQEWDVYVSKEDGFKVDFPGQPQITDTSWMSEYGYILPGRVHSAAMGGGRYSMTVVDYTGVERLGMERSERCPIGAETCLGQPQGQLLPVIGPGYAIQDIRGAIAYAALKFFQREGARVTAFTWNFQDLVEGYEVNLTNADGSRTMGFLAMHENKLYILDGTVPKGYPEPGLFYQSLQFVDKNGYGIRYQAVYSNEFHGLRIYPPPPLVTNLPAGFGYGPPPPAAGGR
jgi:hypothetical protein